MESKARETMQHDIISKVSDPSASTQLCVCVLCSIRQFNFSVGLVFPMTPSPSSCVSRWPGILSLDLLERAGDVWFLK